MKERTEKLDEERFDLVWIDHEREPQCEPNPDLCRTRHVLAAGAGQMSMSPLKAAALALALGDLGALHGPLPPTPSRKRTAKKPTRDKKAEKRRAKQKAQRKARAVSRGARSAQEKAE